MEFGGVWGEHFLNNVLNNYNKNIKQNNNILIFFINMKS